ncbi:peptidoglycan DD-metalloendopeptidase family protein [Candidatus Sulfurimonas baltica]|uniref:Peptidoglycan DD-metalloendopeptidase family protein n=1 Tax=Candidatus Sulfurimonas baltica TaxID=2740404 RepID=A0A7S7LUK0_9BACT|nr:peptidoglycan DD-metalloendopeptidase family protein [Candidatus Sulfurimonas baltica]QOY51668.1 peptidoglycan DD-metalloendopeptidase family protein [Candidatus Sulfurimonas baltica]
MRQFLIFLLLLTSLFGSKVETFRWANGESYLVFLERNNLPVKPLYYNLDKDDQLLTEEMRAGIHCHMLRDEKQNIKQILLPLNDELQLHIYRDKNSYSFEVIPIISTTKTEAFTLNISHSPYYDIIKATGSKKLAEIFVSSFKYSLNFKRDLRKGDTLVMIYDQKYRLGRAFSMPILQVAMIEMKKKQHYIYLNSDDRFYDENANEVEGFLLASPVRGARISSRFTKRRFHPILKRWKAHLGVDYAAGRGTPVVAAGSGRVSHAGILGAYGNLIKISHNDGYETRYAHLKSFRRGVTRGKYVKKGQTIGYVGNTGRSTGPHLHFELRKDNVATNPLRVVQVTTKKLKGHEKEAFLKLKKNYNESIELHLKNKTKFVKLSIPDTTCYFYNGGECAQDRLY